ncbi:MAG: hypothetical protein WCR36_08975 [Bacteroidaceae bacterium]
MFNFFIDGREIKQVDQMGKQVLVGYTLASYNELLEVAEQYKKKLEEAGLIEKTLSPEEKQAKQTELLEKMLSKFESIEKRIDSLEGQDD